MSPCECDCFECSVKRHDICRHVLKCIKRPWTKRTTGKDDMKRPDWFDPTSDWPTVAAHVNLDDLDAEALWQEWVDAGDDEAERTT